MVFVKTGTADELVVYTGVSLFTWESVPVLGITNTKAKITE
jgi:hypothetical protein